MKKRIKSSLYVFYLWHLTLVRSIDDGSLAYNLCHIYVYPEFLRNFDVRVPICFCFYWWFSFYAAYLNSQIPRVAWSTTKVTMQNTKEDDINFSLDHSLIMGWWKHWRHNVLIFLTMTYPPTFHPFTCNLQESHRNQKDIHTILWKYVTTFTIYIYSNDSNNKVDDWCMKGALLLPAQSIEKQ